MKNLNKEETDLFLEMNETLIDIINLSLEINNDEYLLNVINIIKNNHFLKNDYYIDFIIELITKYYINNNIEIDIDYLQKIENYFK